HLVEKRRKSRGIRFFRIGIVSDGLIREEKSEQGTSGIDMSAYARFPEGCPQLGSESLGHGIQRIVEAWGFKLRQSGQASAHREWISREGSCLISRPYRRD